MAMTFIVIETKRLVYVGSIGVVIFAVYALPSILGYSNERLVLAKKPNNADILNNKGLALNDLRNSSAAITYFDKALAINPNDTNILNNKGLALNDLGNSSEAITYFDKALSIKPDNIIALNNKNKTLVTLGSMLGKQK